MLLLMFHIWWKFAGCYHECPFLDTVYSVYLNAEQVMSKSNGIRSNLIEAECMIEANCILLFVGHV